jgi:hypothetical protein
VCAVQPRLWCKADRGCGSLAASSPPAGMRVQAIRMSFLLPAAGSTYAALHVIVLPIHDLWLQARACICMSMLLVEDCASPVALSSCQASHSNRTLNTQTTVHVTPKCLCYGIGRVIVSAVADSPIKATSLFVQLLLSSVCRVTHKL